VFVEQMKKLNPNEMSRYARHLALAEVGISGQEKLKASKVLIVGAGGLGSPAALYLAAGGIGTIGLIDYDKVDSSNLQRQILFSENSVGKNKLREAKKKLAELNSNIIINLHEERLTTLNALNLFSHYDLVIDGSDNFQTRYLVNDACIIKRIPYIFGSIFRFSGQVSVFAIKDGPCYRCLYPEPPDADSVPNCNEDGVIGVLPGVIGTLMATEAIKVLLGIGKPLIGRLLNYDALTMQFKEFAIKKNTDCPICGKHPSINELIDYEEFCNGGMPKNIGEISVKEYSKYRMTHDHILLDVREEYEFSLANIGGLLIPLDQLLNRINEIPKEKEIIVMCQHGIRSRRGAKILKEVGFTRVRNLSGGIKEWSEKVDASIPKY
jgi:molybdopterin/thiamine biosynthesis adenylyltransferase/rhodanese-related sulfurtransferase